MKKQVFLLLISCCLLACQSTSEKEANKAPNIILIMVDDLGSQELGAYGNTALATPNIDSLAAGGLLCSQAYSGSSVCAPARATLLTGLHTGQVPLRGNTGGIALPDSSLTIAEVLQKAGYATGGFGKWGLGDVGTEGVPEQQGFDRFLGYYHQIHAHDYYPEYLWENSQKVPMLGLENDPKSYAPYRIFDEMKKFIRSNVDQTFFCYAPWTAPHPAFTIPSDDPAVPQYANQDWSDERKTYASMVSMIDRQVGELVALLRELDLEQQTLILFCSDNGGLQNFATFQPNGPLRGFKRDLYEGGIRVPLLAYWPGQITPGSKLDLPLYFPDLFPTLAEISGNKAAIPRAINGRSFAPQLRNPTKTARARFLYWEYPHYDWAAKQYDPQQVKQALRYNQWKMIRQGAKQEWEFYDLDNDPGETDNISAYHPGKMKRFQEMIEETRTEMSPQIEPAPIEGQSFR